MTVKQKIVRCKLSVIYFQENKDKTHNKQYMFKKNFFYRYTDNIVIMTCLGRSNGVVKNLIFRHPSEYQRIQVM